MLKKGIEYKTEIRSCELHGEYEGRIIKLKIAGVDYDMPFNIKCPKCLKIEQEKEEAEKEKEKEQNRIKNEIHDRECLESRGVTKRYLNNKDKFSYTTDFFSLSTRDGIPVTEFLIVDKTDVDTGIGRFVNNDNLLICGGCGVGKSYFAYKLTELSYNIREYYFIKTIDEIASMYRLSDYNKFSFASIKEKVDNNGGIIIDEIDNAKDEVSLKALDMLISYCYDAEKRLILIGNGSFDELKKIFTTKALSRIEGTFQIINTWDLKDMRNAK